MILFWAAVLAITALLYVLLDGFDLGVGILSAGVPSNASRDVMMSAISPVWDGNETWLVATGVVLWGAFPLVYAILLSAFYLPLCFMLAGLILRGVAFEYRHRTERWRWLWDGSFAAGSFVAAFTQGVTVGALVEGLPLINGRYVGGDFGWLNVFSILCGIGLCVGYALLGGSWLVRKCDGEVRDLAWRLIPRLSLALFVFLIVVFAVTLAEDLRVMERWLERPYLLLFPAIGLLAARLLATGVRRRRDAAPFLMVTIIFTAAFGTLAISFWPYMIPFSITVEQAAAPHSSLAFMFWGAGLFIFPLTLVYTAVNYSVFRGRVLPGGTDYPKRSKS